MLTGEALPLSMVEPMGTGGTKALTCSSVFTEVVPFRLCSRLAGAVVTVGEVGISLERRPKRLNEPSPLANGLLASFSSIPGVTVRNGDGDVGGVGFEERRSRVP
jgi:Flp pilus assembly protein protease CpaA